MAVATEVTRSTRSSARAIPAPAARPSPAASDLPGSPHRRPGSPSDDEILGLDPVGSSNDVAVGAQHSAPGADAWQDDADSRATSDVMPGASFEAANGAEESTAASPEDLRAVLDANPDLRRAWDDAQAYRESFASPDDARTATALLADLDRMDALFFSRRPEDHAELARAVASLDPAAFASLAQAMQGLAISSAPNFPVGARHAVPGTDAWQDDAHPSQTAARAALPNGASIAKDDRRARHAVPLQLLTAPARRPVPLQLLTAVAPVQDATAGRALHMRPFHRHLCQFIARANSALVS